ncbi:helix-turn-helix domain-containing protein [Yinghuangia sp. YIM S10712]|uniref:helix-turn-helix domain-containing protein n=1 Tax=Yinghuangia sp. YIM S10712 TaxID=3436930 RepID=UPI003F529EB9
MNSQAPMAWRYCGNQIKLWRTRAGVTRQQLGEEAGYCEETIKSVEQGRRRASLHLLQVADQMCGADGMVAAAQAYLQPERYPARTHEFMGLEASATSVLWYEPMLIPGLLQTPQYARALMIENCPPFDDDTIEERLSARMERQEKLTRKPYAQFGFVIHEAALRSLVGGRDVMKAQLGRLLEIAGLRNVAVQVLRADSGTVLGLGGSLVLLETDEHEHYAYVEAPATSALYSDPATISLLTRRHGIIRMQALNAEDSAGFIAEVEAEL